MSERPRSVPDLLLAGGSLVALVTYVAVAVLRLSYPFDLEWMEGGSVDHVVRLLAGQPLYVPPGTTFIPYEYPPFYFWLSAVVARLTGAGYLPLRVVSFAASLAVFGLLARLVRHETGRAWAGLLAAGLFAATFRASGAWFDLARVDSLMLALVLWGMLTVRTSETAAGHAAAGVVWTAAFLTKQPALAIAAPVVLLEVATHWRRGLALALTLGAGVGGSSLLLHWQSGGWFTFYVWEYPFRHALTTGAWWRFWTADILGTLPVATVIAGTCLWWLVRRRPGAGWFWLAATAGLVGAAYRSRLQTGGYDNVLMPAYAALCLLTSWMVSEVLETQAGRSGPSGATTWRGWIVTAACLAQFARLAYDPRPLVPRAADRAAGEALLARLKAVPGPVLLPYHGYYSTMAGKGMTAHLMQIYDILKVGDDQSTRLADTFRRAIREQAFGAIVLDDTRVYYFMDAVNDAYEPRGHVFPAGMAMLPVTGGVVTEPDVLFVPRARTAAQRGRTVNDVLDALTSPVAAAPSRVHP